MSRRFPVCTAREVTKVLHEHGFVLTGQRGSHQKWRHPNGRQVIVTLKNIIEGSGLDVDAFR